MALKDLLNEYRFDEEFIYEGLLLDISVQLKKLMEEKGCLLYTSPSPRD